MIKHCDFGCMQSFATKFSEFMLGHRSRLPIAQGESTSHFLAIPKPHLELSGKDSLLEIIRENDVIVLIGETGSGKTTRETRLTFVVFSSEP